MAFILTPRFAPAYQASQCNPFGLCAPTSRYTYTYPPVSRPQPRRPQYSSFNHFFNQVDELLGEIDREAQRRAHIEAHLHAQREAHRQRQQRKRALRAKFAITRNDQGWQVNGDIRGFAQENINIEVTDDHTLKISGNTQWQSEKAQQVETEAAPTMGHEADHPTEGAQNQDIDGVTLNEPEVDNSTETATPDSDTESHKSYQATVEDDFEDLGAEMSSLVSSSSGTSTPAEPKEPKGKEKAIEEPVNAESAITTQPQPEARVHQPQQEQEKSGEQEPVHGFFERTFRFPERIQAESITASFKDGVLRVNVPKAHVPQVRKIAIL